jgi:hypothetical protein
MRHRTIQVCLALSLAAAFAMAGCEKKPDAAHSAAGTEEALWCAEHGVPESICTRCSPALIADFKQKGDWCKDHNLPKSQCIQCDPSLQAKLEAMKPGA